MKIYRFFNFCFLVDTKNRKNFFKNITMNELSEHFFVVVLLNNIENSHVSMMQFQFWLLDDVNAIYFLIKCDEMLFRDIPRDIEEHRTLSFPCRAFLLVWGWRNCLMKFHFSLVFIFLTRNSSQNSPFLATCWVNLESHGCCNETIIFFIKNVVHFEWSSIFHVSVASQFNTIDVIAVGECGILEWDACSEFAIKNANFWINDGCGKLDNCQKLWENLIFN